MAWIEIHQSLPTHRKTLLAADALGITPVQLMGHMVAFWLWALDNVPDGDLDNISPRVISRAAQWEGNPEQFVDALISVGFIDETPTGLAIHDWYDYAGRLIERRIAERERSRARRSAAQDDGKATTDGRPTNDQRSTTGQPTDDQQTTVGTVQYPTVQYPTVPNSTNDKEYICASTEASNSVDKTSNGEAAGQDSDHDRSDEQRARTPFRSLKQQQRFDAFWEAYPRKRSKGQAEKTWVKINPDDDLLEEILAGLENAKRSVEWQKDGGQYIQYPSTWLNAKGWEDEYEEAISNGKTGKYTVTSSGTGEFKLSGFQMAGEDDDGGGLNKADNEQ